ncbi:Putative undecaprenyl-diphosphatase YbjG [Chryseobacterium aquaeductus]|uniref:Undecaprenyl-diphosphatase YbjG n=1 Tax=Chryseobacterium aquaeductus TaxID=2675056 RepID=A0A9N8MJ72_9FLAO|nr:phosphatase PAP2 family protein [Chryseobacterium aquaeductus]CAA7332420.1 Putative undecaprenyl-diphosphatase YbjG [Chryseobacterium potabilaquae]CAD7816309.1 Putative undecaprenyl-diphosphatase YbjG [Chryseobacterium aquaeductus]
MNSTLEYLNQVDTELFLAINGKHNAFFDTIMFWASDKLFWFPFYAILLIFLIKLYKKFTIYILLAITATITLCDQTASGLLKNLVKRFRPSHEPALAPFIHLSKAGAGGNYGFVSSHSANAFGLVTFLFFLLPAKYNWLKIILFFWALLVSYSRIYNGVHYPFDILGGAIVGILSGSLIWIIFKTIFKTKNL